MKLILKNMCYHFLNNLNLLVTLNFTLDAELRLSSDR